jgi:hypothetical protein
LRNLCEFCASSCNCCTCYSNSMTFFYRRIIDTHFFSRMFAIAPLDASWSNVVFDSSSNCLAD